jgi:hypothetical protein
VATWWESAGQRGKKLVDRSLDGRCPDRMSVTG